MSLFANDLANHTGRDIHNWATGKSSDFPILGVLILVGIALIVSALTSRRSSNPR